MIVRGLITDLLCLYTLNASEQSSLMIVGVHDVLPVDPISSRRKTNWLLCEVTGINYM